MNAIRNFIRKYGPFAILLVFAALLTACSGSSMTGKAEGNVALTADGMVMKPGSSFCLYEKSTLVTPDNGTLYLVPGQLIEASTVVTITKGTVAGEFTLGTCDASSYTGAVSTTVVNTGTLTTTLPAATITAIPATPVPATPAPVTLSCPSAEDISKMGTVEYWLEENGQVAGAHLTFSRTVSVSEFNGIDAIHKDSVPVTSIDAGFQGSLWVKTPCRPIAGTTVSVATPPAAVCAAPTIAELQLLAQPGTDFNVLSDKGVLSGVHMTFAADWVKPCWVDAIQKDGKSWDYAPAGAEVTVWVLSQYRPLK